MIYRIRRCAAVPENLAAFHQFFNEHLLPVQLKHGARLVGRWETDSHEVLAVWEYDDEPSYQRIEAGVRADPASAHAREVRASLPPLFTARHESLARSTVIDRAERQETADQQGRQAHRRGWCVDDRQRPGNVVARWQDEHWRGVMVALAVVHIVWGAFLGFVACLLYSLDADGFLGSPEPVRWTKIGIVLAAAALSWCTAAVILHPRFRTSRPVRRLAGLSTLAQLCFVLSVFAGT